MTTLYPAFRNSVAIAGLPGRWPTRTWVRVHSGTGRAGTGSGTDRGGRPLRSTGGRSSPASDGGTATRTTSRVKGTRRIGGLGGSSGVRRVGGTCRAGDGVLLGLPVREVHAPVELGQLFHFPAIGRDDEELRVLPLERHEGQARPVRAPLHPPARSRARRDLPPVAAVDVHDERVRDAVLDGDEGDPSAVGRDVRAVGRAVRVLRGDPELDVAIALGQPLEVFPIAAPAAPAAVAAAHDAPPPLR